MSEAYTQKGCPVAWCEREPATGLGHRARRVSGRSCQRLLALRLAAEWGHSRVRERVQLHQRQWVFTPTSPLRISTTTPGGGFPISQRAPRGRCSGVCYAGLRSRACQFFSCPLIWQVRGSHPGPWGHLGGRGGGCLGWVLVGRCRVEEYRYALHSSIFVRIGTHRVTCMHGPCVVSISFC